MTRRTIALLVAAGSGSRVGGEVPKQYWSIAGKAIIAHAVDALLAHTDVETVQVVIGAGQEAEAAAALAGRDLPSPVTGGATRRESVRKGLEALAAAPPARVLIHDAARPFLPCSVVDRLLVELDAHQGAIPVLPIADTLVRFDGTMGDVVAREDLYRVQTPQAFVYEAVLAAHRLWPADRDATDDAQMVREAGHDVTIVTGDPLLDKLTYPADFDAAERRLSGSLVSRTGSGFDVHGFTAGDGVWLGGVRVPHDRALAGHSDADVALHALTDALLGTIADGDIGSHFPPGDPQWRGVDSSAFVLHACDRVRAAGGRIDHVDLTIICEAPKVGPYRDAMRGRIAGLLAISEARVSVKATTTERLGFTGRGEGIAAQAVASVRLPEDAA